MRQLVSILTVLLACWCSPPARAQGGTTDDVLLRVVSVGVGGLARAGDWAGVLVEFQDQGAAQREVIIEVTTEDIDGDRPAYQRAVTTNPTAGAERVWVYAFLQPADQDRPLTVSAFEAIPSNEAAEEVSGVRYTPGTLLGRITTAGQPLRPPELATTLVVGRQPAGLSGYGSRMSAGDRWMARGHEATDVAGDLDPLSLPDRATGYSGIETIIWTSADPTRLTPTRADALLTWIRGGGHLVVSLPASPQVWFDEARNPLASVLPAVIAERDPGPIEAMRPLLSYDEDVELPETLIVHRLSVRADAGERQAEVSLLDQADRAVVVRRREGLGSVTLIGFDVSNRALASRGMPGMRPFWHRVLGRVGLPRDSAESEPGLSILQTDPRFFDADIRALIDKSQAVVLGVLAGFGVFGLYWLFAAPVGYMLLSKASLKRHAWVAFAATTVVFTAVTWGGVMVLRPSEAEMQAVVFVDAAEGTTRSSARAFATVLVPKYGQGAIRIGDGASDEYAAVAPWADYSSSVSPSLGASFPDVRSYAVSGRDPDRMAFPARSTVKSLRADWAGERRWASFRAVDASGAPARLTYSPDMIMQGRLTHGLPGVLEDALVLVVSPQHRLARRVGQADIADVRVRRIDEWAPGELVDLRALTSSPDEIQAAATRRADRAFFEDLAKLGKSTNLPTIARDGADGRAIDRLLATALMSRMPPARSDARGERAIGLRRDTHGLDLGEWFTQPSVIVLGVVRLTPEIESPLPISIRTGGEWESLRAEGLAVVRWVYTLDPSPPDASTPEDESADN